MKNACHVLHLLCLVLSLGVAATSTSAAAPLVAARTGTESAEQKAALAVLDRLFGRIDQLAAKVDDADYKNIVRTNVEALKARSESLRQNFDTAVFQDLKFDATIEHHRIARWLAEPDLKPVPATAGKSTN
jgi:TolA-binding protein